MTLATLLPKKKKAPKGFATPPITVPSYRPEARPSGHAVPARLAGKLAALGRRFRYVRSGEKIAHYLTIALILVTLQMFLDWLVDLDFLVRALFLAADLWLLFFFARKQLLPPLLHPPKLEACALMVEKHWPKLRGRVIATVQLARPSFTADSPALIGALQQETAARTHHLDFGEIVPTRVLIRRAGVAAAVLVVWIGLLILAAPGSVALLERVFLLPAKVPRKTEVVCLSGSKIIPTGDSVLLEAQARGIIPSHGRVTLVDATGRIQEITLDPEPGRSDRFSLKIDRVEAPFSYTIRLNDGTSDSFRIKTVPRPDVVSIDCVQIYPAYTGMDKIKRTVGNLALLAGSHLQVHAMTNSRIVKATLKLEGLNQERAMAIAGADGNELTDEIAIPAAGLTGFSIQLTNEAGITSGDATQYRIDLIPDHPPTAQLISPERLQELYTLKAKPTIVYAASDDYGLAQITLCYRVVEESDEAAGGDTPAGGAPAPAPKRIEMTDLGTTRPLTFQGQYQWDLAAVRPPLTEGTTVEYWMQARDANNVTGPGLGESEHHTIKVVSEIEKKAEVMNRLMDSLSTITDISQNQQKINQDLGNIIQGKPASKQTNP
jgi:hypothetical protein